MITRILDKTMEYLNVPAVVGHEQFFMDFLARDFRALGLSAVQEDGLLCVAGADPQAAILCAHIDRHGLISLGDDEYVYAAQYMREIKYGENNRLAREQVQSIASRFEGEKLYAYDPQTGQALAQGVIEACNPCMLGGDALFYVQDMPSVAANIPLAYARTARFEDGKLRGQIDNAISLSVIYALFENGFTGTALFTAEEEIGKSWLHLQAHLQRYNLDCDSLLVLDTSPYTDPKSIENGRVVLRHRDMTEIFNPALIESLQNRAEALEIIYEFKDTALLAAGRTVDQLGSTELGRLIKGSEGRWNGATVQIPTLMYHTSHETTTDKAIANYYQFLHNILIQDPLDILRARDGEQ